MSVHQQSQQGLIDYEHDYVTRGFVLQHCPGLTRSQLNHWILNGWVATHQPRPRSLRYIYRSEYYKIRYMNYLVQELGMYPSKASSVADAAVELMNVHNGRTWVILEDAHIGIPIIKEQL